MNHAPFPDHVSSWLAEPLPSDVRQSLNKLANLPDVVHLAVMPDVHLAEQVCVGVALATSDSVYPQAVGSDIGCGMAALALNVEAAWLRSSEVATRLLIQLRDLVPCLKRTSPAEFPADLSSEELSTPHLQKCAAREGTLQAGTLGRGNHFLEFQRDDDDRLWLMVHSGSRSIGQAITEHHLRQSTQRGHLLALETESAAGQAYLHDHNWAVRYATWNRELILRSVCDYLQSTWHILPDWSTVLQTSHNHVRREEHFGQPVWVHRKGALPAGSGEPGLIPGSMGTSSFHVEGRGCPRSLCSSSHGAGRRFSRSAAARRISSRDLAREMQGIWFDTSLCHALREEAPGAYKNIRSVMQAQRELTCIDREVWPVLTYKGS